MNFPLNGLLRRLHLRREEAVDYAEPPPGRKTAHLRLALLAPLLTEGTPPWR